MFSQYLDQDPEFNNLRKAMTTHRVFEVIDSVERLKRFMEAHVFAVWDFMSLLKRIQRDFTCTECPWVPTEDATGRRLINQIVLDEESDLDVNGHPASHFEMYLSAMDEIGADTSRIRKTISTRHGGDVAALCQAMHENNVPEYVSSFVKNTIKTAAHGKTVEVMAAFLYGREDVIPDMFRRLQKLWDSRGEHTPQFSHYLQRHIVLDDNDHAPAVRQMLEKRIVCGESQQLAVQAAKASMAKRVALWDGLYQELQPGH
jgi:hypothetical protein